MNQQRKLTFVTTSKRAVNVLNSELTQLYDGREYIKETTYKQIQYHPSKIPKPTNVTFFSILSLYWTQSKCQNGLDTVQEIKEKGRQDNQETYKMKFR